MTQKPNNFSIKQWPEGECPREKLIQFGAERLTDAELLAFLLDGQNNLLAERIISEGIPTQSVVYTRKVMEEALRLSASAVVVVHNHPSGEATPSPQDIKTTQKMKQAAEIQGRLTLEIKAILKDAGAVLERETS